MQDNFQVHKKEYTLDVSVQVDDKKEYGSFELYDIETGGADVHAEGGLWFEGKSLRGYDGVFELPKYIMESLTKAGYDTSYADN